MAMNLLAEVCCDPILGIDDPIALRRAEAHKKAARG
jgi:hypothetical protein